MVFPVVMYGCESWTIKKAEHSRIDAFELWCWRRLLRVPWTARRSNQSIQKEISPGCTLEGLILKLKLQYFGHLMQRADSLAKTLMLGNIEGRRKREQQRMRWLDGITDSTEVTGRCVCPCCLFQVVQFSVFAMFLTDEVYINKCEIHVMFRMLPHMSVVLGYSFQNQGYFRPDCTWSFSI